MEHCQNLLILVTMPMQQKHNEIKCYSTQIELMLPLQIVGTKKGTDVPDNLRQKVSLFHGRKQRKVFKSNNIGTMCTRCLSVVNNNLSKKITKNILIREVLDNA